MRNRVGAMIAEILSRGEGNPHFHHRISTRPKMVQSIKRLMRYLDNNHRILFVAVSPWGEDQSYATYWRNSKGVLKRKINSLLPPRKDLREAQFDLDKYAAAKGLSKVEQ